MSNKIPIVDVVRQGDQFVFFCKHCNTEHRHGGTAEGHRRAHCTTPGSPYAKTGYVLKEVNKAGVSVLS